MRWQWIVALAAGLPAVTFPLHSGLRAQNGVAPDPSSVTTLVLTLRPMGQRAEPLLLRTQKGERLRLEVTTERPVVMHLHGFNIELVAEPGRKNVIEFLASATGRFPIHVHETATTKTAHGQHHRAPFAYLEVHPK